ncbi:hypothetical protein N7481_012099 [Penicillium waksmanii]|uniref:uncharacterized protein n=1 Tax=Penicillium waksmanii TaxID=69791 RepID=UPI002547D8DB|nr:uncharacterized protein N7481_012099 [Penicillium waksmanii]KAJ5965385.1 hypothetical protein N7481_012099 [Penicillium waksmanii]
MAAPVDAKLLKKTKFPPEFSRKVDMKKVNIEVMKKWIASRISDILGNEDDVVIELCFNLLEGTRFPDIKSLQIQLTGFLDRDTAKFCQELWSLCLSGQENPQGVPKELLEAKKLELMQEKAEAEKAAEAARRQKEQEQNRDREMDDLRRRERAHDLRPDTEAGNDTVNPHLAAISIPTSRLAITEAVDQITPPIRAPLLAPAHRPVDSAAAASADRNRRNAEIARKIGRGDEARTTVIETDPYPEMIPPAHQVPGETEADAALSPAA